MNASAGMTSFVVCLRNPVPLLAFCWGRGKSVLGVVLVTLDAGLGIMVAFKTIAEAK